MLLNEFLKEHRKVEAQNRRIQEQEATITQLKKEMETVIARLKKQDSKIQKVSDQLAAASPSRGGLEISNSSARNLPRVDRRALLWERASQRYASHLER